MQYNITKYLLFNYLTIFVIAIIINYAFHSKMLFKIIYSHFSEMKMVPKVGICFLWILKNLFFKMLRKQK